MTFSPLKRAPLTPALILACGLLAAGRGVLRAEAASVSEGSSAQVVSPSNPIAWDEAVRLAREHNPDLQAAKLAVESAELSWRASGADYFPQISASADYARSGSETRLANGGTVKSADNSYSGGLSARQSLFSGFRTQAGREIARARYLSAQMDLALSEAALAQSVRTDFINLLTAQENIVLLKKIRDRRAENKRLIGLRFDAGRENRGSFLRAAAQFSQAEFEVARAARSLKVNQRSLARSLGRDYYSALAVTGTFTIEAEPDGADIGALARRTPEYRKQEAALRQAQAGLKDARSAFYPDLSASASLRRRGDEFPLDTDSWSLGLSLSYPIFSGLTDYFGARRAKVELRRSSIQLDGAKREIEAALEDAYAGFWDALGQSDVQRQFLAAAEERAQIARAQYTTGLISFQDWDIIESDLINTQKQNLTALRDAATAGAAWKKAQGKGF